MRPFDVVMPPNSAKDPAWHRFAVRQACFRAPAFSGSHATAVDIERLPGDEGRVVAGEE